MSRFHSLLLPPLTCCFFLAGASLFAQASYSPVTSPSAKEWLIDGESCLGVACLADAYLAVEEGLRIAHMQGELSLESEALMWMSECAFFEQKYEKAIEYCLVAKEIVEDHLNPADNPHYFTLMQTLGACNSYLGRLDQQRSYYRQALDFSRQYFPDDDNMRAEAYSMISSTYYKVFKLDSALFWVDSTILFSREKHLKPRLCTSLLNKAVISSHLNDYDRAIQLQQEALSITEHPNEIILGLTNLADYYLAIGQTTEALASLQKARHLIQEGNKSSQGYYAMVELRACDIYNQTGDSLRFKQTLDSVLVFIPADDKSFASDYRIALAFSAQSALRRKEYLAAEQICRRAILIGVDRDHSSVQSLSYELLAEALSGQGRHQEAVEVAQQILVLANENFDSYDLFDNPPIKSLQAPENDLGYLSLKMRLLLKAHQQQPQQNHLQAALSTYYITDSLLMNNRRLLRSQASRLALAQAFRPFNQAAVQLFYELYQIDQNNKWLDQAFRSMERGRSLLISESLAQAYAIEKTIPDSLRQRESQYSIRSNYLRLELRKHPPSEKNRKKRQTWNQELSQNEQAWDQFLADLEQSSPAYYQLKYTFPFAYPSQIQEKLLNEQEALLSFVECDSFIYCVGIRPDTVCFERLSLSQPLSDQVTDLRAALDHQSDDYYPIAGQLYQEIIKPLYGFWQGHQLLLIPDGKLWLIPFGALPTQEKIGSKRPQAQDFLIEQTNIRWLYAAHGTILQKRNANQASNAPKTYAWVGLAPYHDVSSTQEKEHFSSLPGSKKELLSIQEQLHALPHKMFLGKAANKENFFAYANDTEIMHLATHTLLDEEQASLSSLLFYPNESIAVEQRELLVQELFSRRWLAELTVLSACQTHSGKIEGGEGIAGIARAFSLAGCPNIVASLWNVNDLGSSVLMETFYENMLLGKGKNDAYSEAQRQYLDKVDPLLLHPYFWASFVHIGDNMPIQLPAKRSFWEQWKMLFSTLSALLLIGLTIRYFLKSRA